MSESCYGCENNYSVMLHTCGIPRELRGNTNE
jgi:hypothetical protein